METWKSYIEKRNRAPSESARVYIGEPNEGESAAEIYVLYGCEQMVSEGREKIEEKTDYTESIDDYTLDTRGMQIITPSTETARDSLVQELSKMYGVKPKILNASITDKDPHRKQKSLEDF